ncbi:TIGR02186 family protein [Desulfosarcina cetonica]|uniref:TIGR02186 family protein n=1 Tax=Desulfosarcina cetonica TaxID=90730 RepID=UPI0009F86DA6|nr:TIGR02186 family protein [Desulfosarcina cetonica]
MVRLTGPPEDRHLKQKGRALGVLWMNLGSVEISNVPSVFLLYLPKADAPSPAKRPPAWQSLGLGLKGLAAKAAIVAADTDQATIFNEFVKLKEKSGLYGVMPNVVHYGPDDGIQKTFQATLALPAALPQGDYHIAVLAIQDGAVSTSAIQTIDARETGMPAWISAMAFNHGTLYGVLAVVVAVIAGLTTGILFKDKGGAH